MTNEIRQNNNYIPHPSSYSTTSNYRVVDNLRADKEAAPTTYMDSVIGDGINCAINCGAPEDYIKLGISMNEIFGLKITTNNSLEQQLAKLPKKSDGRYDIDKIKKALEIVYSYHKQENKKAYDMMNKHGMFSKMINGESGYLAYLIGPELTKVIKENGILGDDVQRYLNKHDSDAISIFPTNDTGDGKGINTLVMKSSQAIKKDITNSNETFEKFLTNLNQTNIKEFLREFTRLTGTTFDYDGILKTQSLLSDPNVPSAEKLGAEFQYYGESINLVEAIKNDMATDISRRVTVNTICSIVANKGGIPGKIAGNIVPVHINVMEALTAGAEEGEWINEENLTWDNFWEVNKNIASDLTAVNMPPLILKMFSRVKLPLNNNLTQKFGSIAGRKVTVSTTINDQQRAVQYLENTKISDIALDALDPSGITTSIVNDQSATNIATTLIDPSGL